MKSIVTSRFNKEKEILSKEFLIGSILYSCTFSKDMNSGESFQWRKWNIV